MKKSVLLVSAIFMATLILIVKPLMAETHDPQSTTELTYVLKDQIKYPVYAQENLLSGFVVVAFSVNTDGKITIQDMSASSDYFSKYVETELQKLEVSDAKKYQGQTIYYRFDFKLLNNS